MRNVAKISSGDAISRTNHFLLTCCSLAEIWNGNGKAWWQGARAASLDKLRAIAAAGISRLPCSEHLEVF
jgi:hypothetical protein